MCDNINHKLIIIYSTGEDDFTPAAVVRWCIDCGAVVVDREFDNKTQPGAIMKMRFPKRIYNEQKDNSI